MKLQREQEDKEKKEFQLQMNELKERQQQIKEQLKKEAKLVDKLKMEHEKLLLKISYDKKFMTKNEKLKKELEKQIESLQKLCSTTQLSLHGDEETLDHMEKQYQNNGQNR